MDEPSVMGTENALLAAALTPGETLIGNAACEPHVVDLARMLVKMGADIRGHRLQRAARHRRAPSSAAATHDIGPDHIEIGSFMAMAGVTGGEIRIRDTEPDDLRMIRLVFRRTRAGDPARRRRRRRAGRPEARRRARPRRAHEQGPGRAVAGVPRRPDLDRGRAGHPERGRGPRPRVDVRVAPVLLRQADLDGRQHLHRRPAPRAGHRPAPAARRARRVARHPRRHGGAARGAVRRGPHRDRQHPPDRPRLRADRRAPARARRADRARRRASPPWPSACGRPPAASRRLRAR